MSDPGLPGSGQAAGFQAQFGTFLQLLTKIALNMPSVPISAGQYPGTTTNDNAAAGNIGEYPNSSVPVGSAVSLVSATPKDVASIPLTAGDWNVESLIAFNSASGTTTFSLLRGWTSLVSATLPTDFTNGGGFSSNLYPSTLAMSADVVLAIGRQRVSVAAPTIAFLSAEAIFATSTLKAYGFISARRAR